MTDPALAALLTAAHSDDPQQRQQAALALGARPHPDRADLVVALMADESDDFVRETLVWAVVAHGRATVPALLARLADQITPKERVLHTLSKLEDPDTASAIAPFVDDPDPAVASKAVWALARIGEPESLPVLVSQLGATDPVVHAGVTRALVHIGADAVPAVQQALSSASPEVRAQAVDVLVRLADPDSYSFVDRRSHRVDAAMAAAREAVLATDAPETGQVLASLVEDSDHERTAAVARDLLTARSR